MRPDREMYLDQILQQEIKDTEIWLCREKEESTYKRDLQKRIELINWTLDNMQNSDTDICSVIETRMNEIILKINQTHEIFEADILHGELRILGWIFYQVCVDRRH